MRSTKSGPSGPATLAMSIISPVPSHDAQRRPALPGRQPRSLTARMMSSVGRSTKAGPSGPATPLLRGVGWAFVEGRSTKAGPSGPATRMRTSRCATAGLPLNEGRPFRAGNPSSSASTMARPKSAQRRPALPGRQPRRSTRRASPEASAQRRPALPGRQPHPAGRPHRDHRSPLNEGRPFRAGNPHKPPQVYPIRVPRSTKAGPSGPATPVLVPLRGEGHVFRSTKAGPSGPATPAHSGHAWPSLSPLNEGRPFRAGNPPAVRREGQPSRRPLNEGRPFRAGNPGPLDRFSSIANVAQRRPALPGRQPTALRQRPRWHSQRSTKAGPSGPATPAEATAGSMLTTALNEGRPFRAGNPRQSRWAARQSSSLNEGRPFRAGNPRLIHRV